LSDAVVAVADGMLVAALVGGTLVGSRVDVGVGITGRLVGVFWTMVGVAVCAGDFIPQADNRIVSRTKL